MKRETADSLASLTALVQQKGDYDKVFLLFLASYDESGSSWCGDCRDAEPVIKSVMDELAAADGGDRIMFVTVFVGQRSEWKTASNAFRSEPFHVKAVPTLMLASGEERLEEAQLLHPEKIRQLLDQ